MCQSPIVLLVLSVALAGQQQDMPTRTESVLLLTDGRVLVGRVEPVTNGYSVVRAYGRITIPAEKVERVFPDMKAAYRYRRRQLNGGEASEYVELAYWCLKYRLFDEAEDCVREALELDPGNDRIRRLARQVRKLREMAARPVPATRSLLAASAEARLADTGGRPIPPEAVRLFAARIQPMITRRCAAASCHGPTTTRTFPLWPSITPAPAVTHYNARQLMKYVNYSSPADSPLLRMATIAHGGARFAPLQRPRQAKAIAWLHRWVETLTRPSGAAGRDNPADAAVPVPPEVAPEPETGSGTEPQHEAPRELPEQLRPSPERQRPAATSRDPFDPEAFNRRFAPPASAGDDQADADDNGHDRG